MSSSKRIPTLACVAVAAILVLIVASGIVFGAGADALPDGEMVDQLRQAENNAKRLRDVYQISVKEGAVVDQAAYAEALAVANRLRKAFGDTPLARGLEDKSIVVAELVKADAVYIHGMVLDRRPAADVADYIGRLLPNLNRAVIVARGKVFPKGMRMLQTADAIKKAGRDVLEKVSGAVRAYANGERESAESLANDAFFTFESTGLGPDTTLLDKALENDVEGAISQFAPDAAGETPGLEQMIKGDADIDAITDQQEVIAKGIETVVELLTKTLPKAAVGDVNGDGAVTIVDALFIAQASLGLRQVDPTAGDVNGDGRVSIVDALFVAQAAAGLREL